MLRALVAGVNLDRDGNGYVRMRIVWSGGLVTETSCPVAMSSFRSTEREDADRRTDSSGGRGGRDDATIAESLNSEGLRPCRRTSFTPAIVGKLRRRHRILAGLEKVRRGEQVPGYTIREMARLIGIDPSWIYRSDRPRRDPDREGRSLRMLPVSENRSSIDQMKKLKDDKVPQVSFPKEHRDG